MPLENIVGKAENAGSYHFLLFSQCFLPFLSTQSRLLPIMRKEPFENIAGIEENAGKSIFSYSRKFSTLFTDKFCHLNHI